MATKTPLTYDPAALDALLRDPRWKTEVWDELFKMLSAAPWAKTAPLWMAQADATLSELYKDDDSRRWPVAAYQRKKAPAALPLVRSLLMPPLQPRAFDALIDHLAMLDPADVPPLTQLMTMSYYKITRVLTAAEAAMIWDRLSHARLRGVSLSSHETLVALIPALAQSPALASIEGLALGAVDDATLCALLDSPHAVALRRLSLGLLSAPSAALALILARRHAARIQKLDLTCHPAAELGREADEALWSQPWPALQDLSIATLNAPPDALRRILDAAPALTKLTMSLRAGDGAIAPMAGATHEALRELRLYGELRSDAYDAAALASPACRGLTRLELRCVPGGLTAQALAGLGALESLTLVVPDEHDLTAFWDAMRGAAMPALRWLTIGKANRDGALAAIASMALPALRSFGFDASHMTAADLDVLETIPGPNGCELHKSFSAFSDEALRDRYNKLYYAALPPREERS
jgi:hypothetical protein